MGAAGPRPLTLDSGALIAFERGVGRMRVLVRLASQTRTAIYVPAGVLAQVWRSGARQAPLAALLKKDHVRVSVLDAATAKAVGVLCGHHRTTDIVDASVVLCARRTNSVVVTSDPDDLVRLDPGLAIEAM